MSNAADKTEPFLARADEIFEAALDLPVAERSAYLDEACAGDEALRKLVDRLLVNCESDETFLAPGGGMTGPLFAGLVEELTEEEGPPEGLLVGRYRIVREVGRGGMAVVYLAERADGQFEQLVALKRLQQGGVTDEVIQRFDRERQILARANHPNIAQLLDGGVDPGGRPFFAMEYVEGRPIDRYCDEERLSIHQRLELFLQVSRAVEYAHRNLVVHRDIKPSNILVTADGHAKLLDFGIAKLLDRTPDTVPLTRSFAQLMTPLYASPEQIQGEPVTTASDVYQLGILLYVLLTGRWPYRVGAQHAGEVVRAICHDQPTRPSTAVDNVTRLPTGDGEPATPQELGAARRITSARLRRLLHGDLDNIVLMALRKEPERRYSSVAQFLHDIESYLAHRPVTARSDTFLYRAGKLVRRHKAAFATAAAALVMLVSLAFYYTFQLRAESERARRAASEATQVADFLRDLFAVSAPTRSRGEQVTARELLDRGARNVERELAGQPLVRASLMTVIGNVYRELAFYEEAEPLLAQAVEVRRELLGSVAPELAESLHGLAWVKEELGAEAEARGLYEEALGIRAASLTPEHLEVARTRTGLGRALNLQGEFDEARGYHELALRGLEAAVGPEHPEVGRTLIGLGESLARVSEYQAARASLERALEILEGTSNDAWVGRARVFRAHTLRHTASKDLAREEFLRAITTLERVYGPDHPEVAVGLTFYAHLLNNERKYQEAISHHERALEIREAAFGSGHRSVASSLSNLGLVHFRVASSFTDPALSSSKQRELEISRRYLERSVDVWERALGPDHFDVTTALRVLGDVLRASGAYADARPVWERVIAIRERDLGENHPRLASPLAALGATLLALGDPSGAEPLLKRALSIGRESHRYTEIIYPRIDLGRCLVARSRFAEAETVLLKNLEASDLEPAAAKATRDVLLEIYVAQGQPEKAEEQRRLLARLDGASRGKG